MRNRLAIHLAAAALALAPFSTSADVVHFQYSGDEGPAYWGDLDAAWAACRTSARQSPIDIGHAELDGQLRALELNLHPTPIHLRNTGHTVELEFEPGSTVTWGGVTYELAQVHFHTLSEHTVQGSRFPIELHAVFRDTATGNALVIGLLLEVGAPSGFLAALTDHLPTHSGGEYTSSEEVDLAGVLTDTAAYYTYEGSLTTPPCSPVVTWVVLKEPASLSDAQLQVFRDVLGNNFRPLQPRNDRAVRATARGGLHRGR